MYESPRELQEILIKYIAHHLSDVSYEQDGKLYFWDSNAFVSWKNGNLLWKILDKEKLLNDKILSLFDPHYISLSHIIFSNTVGFSLKAVSILQEHRISSFKCRGFSDFSVNDIVSLFGKWTLNNISTLCLSGSPFFSRSQKVNNIYFLPLGSYVSLCQLKSIKSLDLSSSNLVSHALLTICKELVNLSYLNISNCPFLETVEFLILRKSTLTSLSLYNLKALLRLETINVILQLNNLIKLDLSTNRIPENCFDEDTLKNQSIVPHLLKNQEFCPQLRYLDISWQQETKSEELFFFLKSHSYLEFIGLLFTSLCFNVSLLKNYNLSVTGNASADQLLEALKRYPDREEYVPKILYKVFHLVNLKEPRPDIIKLILPVLQKHPNCNDIQLAGTACLYNQTKTPAGAGIHPSLLSEVVDITLSAMANFPKHQQLQKNALLTLCSDRILHEVTFDKFRCAQLALDCLLTFNDQSTNRMAVAICSILAAKISTAQTAKLGGSIIYMRKLLNLVKERMADGAVDITLKFTLSALWNLTDESPATCQMFLAEKGLKLFLQLLSTFPEDITVETKVLGLLNNIAEVSPLRSALINKSFIQQLRCLLKSESVDVSYFAAGIVAHLLMSKYEKWNSKDVPREILLEELGSAVESWKEPEEEMVAYRSFQPFIALLCAYEMFQVQLWAVWALHHVTSKNSKRYCPLLVQEGVDQVLHSLVTSFSCNKLVQKYANKVLTVLQENKSEN